MPKKTKEQIERILEDIKKYRNNDKTDEEIMGILSIEIRQFQRYNKIIHERDKEAWLNLTRTQLEPNLFKLKSSLEDTYKRAKELSETNKETEDILAARQAADDARLSIVQLITEGPDYIKHVDEYVKTKERKMDIKSETTK